MNSDPNPRTRLAFIDPGLRKAPFFLELRRLLEPRLLCLYYSRRTMVRGFVRSAQAPLRPGPWPLWRSSDIGAEALRRAVGGKVLALRGTSAMGKARRVLYDLTRYFDEQQVGAILVWNGSNLVVALAVYLARQRGLPVIFAEHGYLPGTMQLDRCGVNFDASITAQLHSGAAQLPPDAALDRALDEEIASYKSGQPMRVLNAQVPAHLRLDLRSSAYREAGLWLRARWKRRPPPLGQDDPELPRRFVLLPFQVKKDSQLLLHSPVVGNDMARLLGLLHAALAGVDPLMRIVVKLHPLERPQVQLRYAELMRRFPDVLFIRRHRVPDLLQKAAAVVTVNSSVGFEALLCDRPVVALGRNFYTAPTLVHLVEQADQLPAALSRALTEPVDTERRRAFLRYVHVRFLTFGSYHDFSERSLIAVAERIFALLDA